MDFSELEKAFPSMSEDERDVVTVLHPLLDALSKEEAAYELCISEVELNKRLSPIKINCPGIWVFKE